MSATMYHGGRRWIGKPIIKPSVRGQAECGPGLYLTTHLMRAKSYAKGGGVITQVRFAPRMWLEDVALPVSEIHRFTRNVISKSKQAGLLAEVAEIAERYPKMKQLKEIGVGPHIPAAHFVNLCVNDDLTLGSKGPALAEFLSSHGIDASLHSPTGGEYWVCVFNPGCIESFQVLSAAQQSSCCYEMPSPREQLELMEGYDDVGVSL